MFRVFGNIVDQRLVISPTYVDDIVATHVIGSAMLSKRAACQAIIEAYRHQIELETAGLSLQFSQLLNSNFYESTGDPRDEALLKKLPNFRAWADVRKVVRERNLHDELEALFGQLRAQHLSRLSDHLAVAHGLDLTKDLDAFTQWRGDQ